MYAISKESETKSEWEEMNIVIKMGAEADDEFQISKNSDVVFCQFKPNGRWLICDRRMGVAEWRLGGPQDERRVNLHIPHRKADSTGSRNHKIRLR